MAGSPILDEYARLDKERGVATYRRSRADEKTATYVKAQVATSSLARKLDERATLVRLAYYTGNQWPAWDGWFESLIETQIDDEDKRTYNYLGVAADYIIARATENRPAVRVVPSTMDDDDQQKARASEKLSDFLWDELNMPVVNREFVQLAVVTGLGCIKVGWDPDAGKGLAASRQSAEASDAAGAAGAKIQDTPSPGLPTVTPLSPLEWGWDPGAATVETARWAFHRRYMHVDEIRSLWPARGPYVKPTTTIGGDQWARQRSDRLKGEYSDRAPEHALVIEYFERPNPRHQDGRYLVLAGDVVLDQLDHLPFGDLPFVVARYKPVFGKMQGRGIAALIDPQTQVNEKAAQRKVATDRMANPPWVIAEGSVDHDPDGVAGEVIRYNHMRGPAPRIANVPPLPAEHGQLQHEGREHIFQLAQISELSMGRIPSGMSGRSIGMATDLEGSILGPLLGELQKAHRDIAKRTLSMWHDMVTVPVTLKVVGRGRLSEVIEFHASDITSTDVRILPDSMLPRHPSYKREQLMMMAERGFLGDVVNDPMARRKLYKLLEWGDLDEVNGENTADRRYAREEFGMFTELCEQWGRLGNPGDFASWVDSLHGALVPSVRPDEDHAIHEDEHRTESMTADFRKFDPECQEWWMRHRAHHDMAIRRQSMGRPWWWEYADDQERAEYQQLQASQQQGQVQGQLPPAHGAQQPPQIDAYGPDPSVQSSAAPLSAGEPIGPDAIAQLIAAMKTPGGAGPGSDGTQSTGPRGPGLPGDGMEMGY